MDERKLRLESNGYPKCFNKHLNISTQSKSNYAVRNTRKSMPKVKLTTIDKSSNLHSVSSSRLKSFPAEEMRRINKTPRPNVFPFPASHPMSLLPSPSPENNLNCDQGDSHPQPFLLPNTPHNHNHTTSQLYLSQSSSNKPQHSEPFIHCNTPQRSPNQQTHRPFVPNTTRNINTNTHLNFNNQAIESSSINKYAKDITPVEETNNRLKEDSHPNNALTIECEKQPVGGRCAAIHRLVHLSKEKQSKTNNTVNNEARDSKQSQSSHECQEESQPLKYYYDFYHGQPINLNKSPTPGNSEFHNNCQCTKNFPGRHQCLDDSSLGQQQQEYPRRPLNKKITKKNYQFTPAMIHDQELLVMTLRQQGINEDIMKRQFETLLNEQRRQLLYQQQLLEAEEKQDDCDNMEILRCRRISKSDQNEKPEWMVHITPPWIPYALIENMDNNPTKEQKKCVRINENCDKSQQEHNDMEKQQFNTFHQIVQHQWPQSIEDTECQNNVPVYPTGILKMQNNDTSIVKQKRQLNNGLQDLDIVRKAMEELKNAQNRKGFEYLAKLNKIEHCLHLNGIQDPDDPLMQNLPYRFISGDTGQNMKKEPSANGLENKRNANNPAPPPNLLIKNYNEPISEYPRRTNNGNVNNYYLMPTDKEYKTVENAIMHVEQQNLSTINSMNNQNIVGYNKNSLQDQILCREFHELHNGQTGNNSTEYNSLPSNMCPEFQENQFNHKSLANEHNSSVMITNPNQLQQYPPQNIQRQDTAHNALKSSEARIIGGIKYFPTTTQYLPLLNTINETQPIAFH